MKPLLPSDKRALVSPFVVGLLLGTFAAYAVLAFSSEYRLSGIELHWSQVWLEASIAFIVCLGGSVGLLGLLPVVIRRSRASEKRDA